VRRALIWRSCAGGRHAGRSYPSDLSDAEWAVLEPLLPPPPRIGRPLKWPRRVIAEAIDLLPRPFGLRVAHAAGTSRRADGSLPTAPLAEGRNAQADAHDTAGARQMIETTPAAALPRLELVWADSAYTGPSRRDSVRRGAAASGAVHRKCQAWRYRLERNPRAFRSSRAAGRSNAPSPGVPPAAPRPRLRGSS
jgi:transposase